MGKLSVFIKANNRLGLLWRFGQDVGDIWNSAQVTISKISNYQNFSLIFEGI